MLYTLLESQEKLLHIAQETKNIELVQHILETTFYYKGVGFVQVSDTNEALKILSKYISMENIYPSDILVTKTASFNRLSKSFNFPNNTFKEFLTELFLSENVELINVAIFLDDNFQIY